MAKRSKSDLVGNLINKRKMMDQSTKEASVASVEVLPETKNEVEEQNSVEAVKQELSKPKVAQKKKSETSKKKQLGEVGSILSELKEGKKQDKYASIKIKSELYNRIKKIARKEGIDRHGHLIDKVLTDFCDRYEEK